MKSITKWNLFSVLVAILALAVSVGGISPSPAFGCTYENGWMTGGGSFFYVPTIAYGGQVGSTGRVTHGFVVHCTPRHSDNLEIVDHSTGLNFHLTDLLYAECWNDAGIEPDPPDAAFDSFYGWGEGRCRMPGDKWQTCYIEFVFTDGGERGGCIRDTASIQISNGNGGLLIIGSDVDCGNHQAHDGF